MRPGWKIGVQICVLHTKKRPWKQVDFKQCLHWVEPIIGRNGRKKPFDVICFLQSSYWINVRTWFLFVNMSFSQGTSSCAVRIHWHWILSKKPKWHEGKKIGKLLKTQPCLSDTVYTLQYTSQQYTCRYKYEEINFITLFSYKIIKEIFIHYNHRLTAIAQYIVSCQM